MTEELRECTVCGAMLEVRRITFSQPSGEFVSLISDVPADVCPQCGEQYLSPDTVDVIQRLLERRLESDIVQVERYRFPPAVSRR